MEYPESLSLPIGRIKIYLHCILGEKVKNRERTRLIMLLKMG